MKVMFCSDKGKTASGSPRAIYDEIVRRGLDAEIAWSMREEVPWIPSLKRGTHAHRDFAMSCDVFVSDGTCMTPYVSKSAVRMQTWHGTPIKCLGYDIVTSFSSSTHFKKFLEEEVALWDVLIAGNYYSEQKFRSAFEYRGDTLLGGTPRNDVLVRREEMFALRQQLRRRLGIASHTLAVLYAPTWRESSTPTTDVDELKSIVKQMPEDSVLLYRGHTNVKQIEGLTADRIIDVSDVPETAHVMAAADLLVTDYSSIAIDWLLLDRPVAFYVPDLEKYAGKQRGLYFDFYRMGKAPGPVVKKLSEFHSIFFRLQEGDAIRREWKLLFCSREDGQASARAVDEILYRLELR